MPGKIEIWFFMESADIIPLITLLHPQLLMSKTKKNIYKIEKLNSLQELYPNMLITMPRYVYQGKNNKNKTKWGKELQSYLDEPQLNSVKSKTPSAKTTKISRMVKEI